MANKGSYSIHPEHDLHPMNPRDPFYCAACKEIGFGSGYGCPQCVVRVHKECRSPSPTMPLTVQRKEHSLKFYSDMKGENGEARFCAACSKPVQGCGYNSSLGNDFHPSCLALPKTIMVNGEEFRLACEMKSNCNWCGFIKISIDRAELPSWSYARRRGEYHVGCVKEMVVESWRNGKFIPAKEGVGAGLMHIIVDKSGISGSGSGELAVRMGELAVRVAIASTTGDFTELFI